MITFDESIADLGYVVYALKIKGTEEIRYVGLTSQTVLARTRQHKAMTTFNRTYALYKWLRKHISDEVELVVLSRCREDSRVLSQFEVFWIAYYRALGHRLLNCTDGGEGTYNLPLESRKRMSDAAKLRVGVRSSMFGKTYSDAERLKKSLQQKGKINIGVHTRWHVNREIVDQNCSYCTVLTSSVL